VNTHKFLNTLKRAHSDCDFALVPLLKLEQRERRYFDSFMPNARSAIVLFHHVKNIRDWVWNCPDGRIESERCNINDRCTEICDYIKQELE
jgi:hypothetical protein